MCFFANHCDEIFQFCEILRNKFPNLLFSICDKPRSNKLQRYSVQYKSTKIAKKKKKENLTKGIFFSRAFSNHSNPVPTHFLSQKALQRDIQHRKTNPDSANYPRRVLQNRELRNATKWKHCANISSRGRNFRRRRYGKYRATG